MVPPSPTLAPYHSTLQRALANRHRRGVPSFDLDGVPPDDDILPRLRKYREELLRLKVEVSCLLRECEDRIDSGKGDEKVETQERGTQGGREMRSRTSKVRRVVRRSALPELMLALVLAWAFWRLSLELRY